MNRVVFAHIQAGIRLHPTRQPHVERVLGVEASRMFVRDPDLHVPGLTYIRSWMNTDEQRQVVALVDRHSFRTEIARRQQFWGVTYYHTTHSLRNLQPTITDHAIRREGDCLPMDAFRETVLQKLYDPKLVDAIPATPCGSFQYHGQWRTYDACPAGIFETPYEPSRGVCGAANHQEFLNLEHAQPRPETVDTQDAPSQILVNEYAGRQGISTHVDDPDAFGRTIAIVSLLQPIVMVLGRGATTDVPVVEQRVLLEPGSLLVLKGEARYGWRHAIAKSVWMAVPVPRPSHAGREGAKDDGLWLGAEWQSFTYAQQEADGSTSWWKMHRRNPDYRRISLTIRKLLPGRKQVQHNVTIWSTPPPK